MKCILKRYRTILALVCLLSLCGAVAGYATPVMEGVGETAQIMNPVKFSSQLRMLPKGEGEIVFSGKIDQGWHVYSTRLGGVGPVEATFNVAKLDGVELVGPLQARGKEQKVFDKLFDANVRYFENAVTFVQRVKFTKPSYAIDCYLEYGACNETMCMPPTEVEFKKSGASPEVTEGGENEATASPEVSERVASPDTSSLISHPSSNSFSPPLEGAGEASTLWQPVVSELQAMENGESIQDRSLFYILLMGFIGGLLAVLMPCIWPIIPMTVSFFLKRAKDNRRKGLRDALTYGAAIVVIYLSLGLLVTALFGSDTLNALSTNAVFNVALFVLLVVFALSFFGWFEISLPDKWANAVDSKASSASGWLSIFLMAFTLVLVSFSCTAPIVGLLLVQTATSGQWLAPAVGMLGFALALALPFTLFALFPTWIKQAPKSGSWMNILKVTLGFIELAFSLKFLSVADLAYGWHLLDREVFLALWIAIFLLLGLYLIGSFKFQSDVPDGEQARPMPVVCVMGGLCSIAFSIYMLPGLWGAPCKAVSAFAPPVSTQDFNLNINNVEAHFTDYEEGMAAAAKWNKPVMIDFTGFGCVNCRKMEAAVWTDPRVAHHLRKDYVLISLFVDDKTPLPEPIEITDDNGQQRTLRTVGAKWSWLQSHKFGANSQPFYVIVTPEGMPLTGSRGYDEDIPAYVDFLKEGLIKFKKSANSE